MSILGGIAWKGTTTLLRTRPAVATSFTRSFATTRINHRPSFFVPRRPSALAPGSHSSLPSKFPLLSRSKHRWSFARYGIVGAEFSEKHPWVAILIRVFVASVFGIAIFTGGIFIHDTLTYSRRKIAACDMPPSDPLSLSPRTGGPKNLPILEIAIDGKESECLGPNRKPRLVILGGGWGAVAILKTIPKDVYNVTVISPQNYFCFTPLLPSACVGTVEPRTLVEPLRHLLSRVSGRYICGSAVDVTMSQRLVEVEIPGTDGSESRLAYVPYDKLIVAVGSRSNDHGVPGLQNCFQLKTIPDAQSIRRRIMSNLEVASLSTTSPEERKRLLSFVVCGGGPTGVEVAAELADMLEEDVLDYYPNILQGDIGVTIVQSRDHILNTYAERISKFAEKKFARSKVEVITNARVAEVKPDGVVLTFKSKDGVVSKREIPSGLTVWSTGIAMQPFTQRMVNRLPNQFHSKAVMVDGYLRVEGAPKGTVYAIGDASTIHLNMLDGLLDLWERFDVNHDGKLDYSEWKAMAKYLRKKYTLTSHNLEKVREVFQEFDTDGDDALRLNEVADMFMKLAKKTTTLPPTAQVASQQGEYIGKLLCKVAKEAETLRANDLPDLDDEVVVEPFKYRHLGSLAYIGNSAALDIGGMSFVGGLMAMYAWRSVYWGEQTSMRARFMLMIDWIKRGIFGRDLSKL